MAQGIGLFILTLFSSLSLVALFIALESLFPRVTARTRHTADLMPGRSLLVGLVNFLFFGAISLAFLAISDGLGLQIFTLPAIFLIILLGIGLLIGLTGVVSLAGERLFKQHIPWQRSLGAGVILVLASLTPFLGWFLLFPYLSGLGLGAFLISWFRKPS